MDMELDAEPLNKSRATNSYVRRERKVNRSRCYSCLRKLVLCLNILILLCCLAVVGVGAWVLVQQYSGIKVFITSHELLHATWLAIGAGAAGILLTLSAFIRRIRENRFCIILYGIVLIVIAGVLVIGGILAFKFRQAPVSDKTKMALHEQLRMTYGIDPQFTENWDSVQSSVKCCGVYGSINSTTSWAAYKLLSEWYLIKTSRTPYVPQSCCSGYTAVCQGEERLAEPGEEKLLGPPIHGPPVMHKYLVNKYLYTDGCYEKAVVLIKEYSLWLSVAAFGASFIVVLGVLITFCFCVQLWRNWRDH